MFVLDPTLKSDTFFIKTLTLSDLLLMNDSRFPWLILVPRKQNMTEIFDLATKDQQILWQEINECAAWAKHYFAADKMNIAALGNIVNQLHIHIVARKASDAVWPKPVWNQGPASSYDSQETELLIKNINLSFNPFINDVS